MPKKITFLDARKNVGLSLEKAALYSNISAQILRKYENDCSEMPCDVAIALSRIYHISLDHLHTGVNND